MNNWTDQMRRRFDRWYDKQDLGALESEREDIRHGALCNAADVRSIEAVQCAKATVAYYLDGGWEDCQ